MGKSLEDLEKEVALLREWVALQERVAELEKDRRWVQYPHPYPVYVPYQPFVQPYHRQWWESPVIYCTGTATGGSYSQLPGCSYSGGA